MNREQDRIYAHTFSASEHIHAKGDQFLLLLFLFLFYSHAFSIAALMQYPLKNRIRNTNEKNELTYILDRPNDVKWFEWALKMRCIANV